MIARRHQGAFSRRHPTLVVLLGTLILAPGCSDKTCATPPDAAVVDAAAGEAIPELCQKEKVQCPVEEINAFGVCLAQSGMVKVPAGEFLMGKTEEGKPHSPEHKVTLKEFLIDKTEVTVAQYKACVDCGACPPPLRDGSHTGREPYFGNQTYASHPVIYVSWLGAKAYCEGIGKRLPTEAEWELAARGTRSDPFPWGTASPSAAEANFGGVLNDTAPVTDYDKGKSAAGALNLAGNVWEWVADAFDPKYYATSPGADPKGPASGVLKTIRGGGFTSTMETIKSYVREGQPEGAAFSHLGFRCAKDQWQ